MFCKGIKKFRLSHLSFRVIGQGHGKKQRRGESCGHEKIAQAGEVLER